MQLNRNPVQNIKFLLQRVAHRAVIIEFRATTEVAGDALDQTRGNIVAVFHPVDQGMTERVKIQNVC